MYRIAKHSSNYSNNCKGRYLTWKDYYEYLISIPVDQGGIEPHGRSSVTCIDDISDLDRGNDVTRQELQLMLRSANDDQKSVDKQVKREMEHNSATFISGAAGTGKSFVLRILESHYRLKGYKVFKMAPTGVAAHNISGQTLHRFFGMTNQSSVPNFQLLDEYVKLYPKLLLLIDEYSMISAEMLDVVNEALIKTNQRATIMGGVKTIFFGDIAQLLPIQKKEGTLWNTKIFNSVCRFHLVKPVRQQDESFIQILNKVRICNFDRSVIKFINDHTVLKRCLPMSCLRLYTTLELVRKANERDYSNFPGEGHRIEAFDSFSGTTEGTARAALKETKLASTLYLKIDMPVMVIQNLNVSQGWVNGTVATVADIDENNICLRKTGGIDDEDED
ncbi:hypothetical protein G6F46_012277 [Rhizopus delemar]|nr:hypothetical protein G6F55_011873 [Rhizopus delemar]KAG1534130.1 hypothetical protein G6F51_012264 [Rhizopus arrhizus]KAG1488313.1 hypothetical protein G6F54_012139 [Rhizopus delemar]KAG1496256.1 hypothetical protein G6F53_012209 [Rhizopus delemar]KAG1511098.1 hypothetical protein G6F52_010739 [Rhizopus delemar]